MPEIKIANLNLGGLADSIYQGTNDSLAKMVGLDIHTTPGLIKVNQKMSKDSSTTIDEFCKCAVACSDGNKYWFSADSGKIWKEASGTYSLVHTTTPLTGEAKCLGAIEYNGYMYWATENHLHRISVDLTGSFGSNVEEDYEAFRYDFVGGTGDIYTTLTSISETAVNQQTVYFRNNEVIGILVHVTTVGTGNWTVTLHDSADSSVGSKTITNGSMSTGFVFFEFSSPVTVDEWQAYHIHVTSTVADGEVTSTTNEDLEGGYIAWYMSANSEFKPMAVQNLVLYIGDGEYVHQVEEDTTPLSATYGQHYFSRYALDIQRPYKVKALGVFRTDLMIGTQIESNVNTCKLFVWNTWSGSYSLSDDVPEPGINAFIPTDNYVLVNAGKRGKLYVYSNGQLQPYKGIPGEYSATATAIVHPNAIGVFNSMPIFGFSKVAGSPTELGIYSFGSQRPGFPYVINMEFPISQRNGGEYVLNNIEIGAMLVVDDIVYYSWKDTNGTPAYGVDKLDTSNKLEKGYFDTRAVYLGRTLQDVYTEFNANYKTVPSGTNIKMYHNLNHAGSYTELSETVQDASRLTYICEQKLESVIAQFRVELNTSSNDAPELESFIIKLQ